MEKGFSLIELIIAMAVFVIVVTGISYLVLDTYVLNRDAKERTEAVFMAEEALEALRAIRDNNWDDLLCSIAECGVVLSDGNWIITSTPDIIGKFTREVMIEEVAINTKKIISRITWEFKEGVTREINLVSFLTNWQMAGAPSFISQLHYRWRNDDGGE